jgi:putative spermidine/putrescine transport system permease protein
MMPRRSALAWLALPVVAALGVVFVWPLARLLRMAFNRTESGGAMTETLTLDMFRAFAGDSFYLQLTLHSLELSVTTATAAVLLAYPVALFLHRMTSGWKTLLTILAVAPLLVNGVVRVFGWLALLGDRGLVNGLLRGAGLTGEPVRLVYNWTGVTIGLTESLMPYAVLALIAGLGRVEAVYDEAAASLGAAPWRRFLRVTLPLSLPALVLAWLLAFLLAMSAFITPKLLGGGRVHTLATELYELATTNQDWPLAAVLAIYMLALISLIIAVYGTLTRRAA